jgi:hypothetical protein
MKKFIINLNKFPVIQNELSPFMQIGDDRKIALQKFNQVLDRVEGSLKFLYLFSQEKDSVIKRAFLRATLAEFVSIEEILPNDLQNNNIKTCPFKIKDSQNPLFHILKQLRNYNIHLGNSGLNLSDKVRVFIDSAEFLKNGEVLEWDATFTIIDNFNLSEFNKLKDAKHFEDNDKISMINWFNQNQNIWGVSHVLHLALQIYCDEIIVNYNL